LKLIVVQILASLQGQPIDYAKITKLTSDTGFEATDTMACISCLKHIIFSAAKFDCDDQSLEAELQQLGLPKEHTLALCRPYKEKKDVLRSYFAEQTLRMTQLESIDWRLDYLISSSSFQDLSSPTVELRMEYTDNSQSETLGSASLPDAPKPLQAISFSLSGDKLRALDHELRAASALMESFQ
jgi:COMM domain containing 4